MPALENTLAQPSKIYGDIDPVHIGWLDFRNNKSINLQENSLSKKDIQIFTAAWTFKFCKSVMCRL